MQDSFLLWIKSFKIQYCHILGSLALYCTWGWYGCRTLKWRFLLFSFLLVGRKCLWQQPGLTELGEDFIIRSSGKHTSSVFDKKNKSYVLLGIKIVNFGETRLIILKNDLSLCVRGLCVNECHTRVTLWACLSSPHFRGSGEWVQASRSTWQAPSFLCPLTDLRLTNLNILQMLTLLSREVGIGMFHWLICDEKLNVFAVNFIKEDWFRKTYGFTLERTIF